MNETNGHGKQFNVNFWHLIITLAVVFASLIFSYATLTSQLADVNRRLAELSARYYQEVVPRNEHLEMNKRLDDRLKAIEDELHRLNQRAAYDDFPAKRRN